MKAYFGFGMAAVTGAALGAAVVSGLHAQAKPPVYYISEINVTNPEGYAKEYLPKVQLLSGSSSGRVLVRGGKITAIEGTPPNGRVSLQVWDSVDKIQAYQNSAEFKELRKIGDKYATFRSYAVEGLPQ